MKWMKYNVNHNNKIEEKPKQIMEKGYWLVPLDSQRVVSSTDAQLKCLEWLLLPFL